MKPLVTIGITAGILAGLWTQYSTLLGLITWVGFLSWACFFAAGGKKGGLLKAIPANLSGVLWGAAIVWGAANLPVPAALGISVAIAVVAMCVQARWSVLAFIPGTFAGCAAYFGTTFDAAGTCIALIAGAGLGWFSEYTAGLLTNAGKKQPAPASETEKQPAI
ncbi:DUF1097 domain-containing protein [uncultured Arthrobacter sp.]|uniref:DUF1097 domain-containing protein n=1 Tax=uncultured Arthrobacter sp. TaxID=114050 RepID=UPI0028CFF3F8|nr:DUF1097 domain-containing protein [uncultured Arthrobacter sp.]